MEIILKRSARAQEFGREHDRLAEASGNVFGVTHWNRRLHDDVGVGIDGDDVTDHSFDRSRIEEIRLRILVRWCGDDDDTGAFIGVALVGSRTQV